MGYLKLRISNNELLAFITIIALIAVPFIALTFASGSTSSTWRPLIGGIQIGIHQGSVTAICSIGYPAYYLSENDVDYYIGFVTAGHCGNIGNDVYQPASGSIIGSIDLRSLKYGDVAFVLTEIESGALNPTTVTTKIYYSFNSNNYITINGYWSAEKLIYRIGETIFKTGAASSTTYGEIYDVRSNWYHYATGIYHKYAIIAKIHAVHGDSGGTVYYIEEVPGEGSYVWVVGTVSAFYSLNQTDLVVCSSIDDAETYLGVTPYDGS